MLKPLHTISPPHPHRCFQFRSDLSSGLCGCASDSVCSVWTLLNTDLAQMQHLACSMQTDAKSAASQKISGNYTERKISSMHQTVNLVYCPTMQSTGMFIATRCADNWKFFTINDTIHH